MGREQDFMRMEQDFTGDNETKRERTGLHGRERDFTEI